jgi:hypothetical protein
MQHVGDRSGPFLELSLAEMLERIKRAGTRAAPVTANDRRRGTGLGIDVSPNGT